MAKRKKHVLEDMADAADAVRKAKGKVADQKSIGDVIKDKAKSKRPKPKGRARPDK
jgi:hypothetical protein